MQDMFPRSGCEYLLAADPLGSEFFKDMRRCFTGLRHCVCPRRVVELRIRERGLKHRATDPLSAEHSMDFPPAQVDLVSSVGAGESGHACDDMRSAIARRKPHEQRERNIFLLEAFSLPCAEEFSNIRIGIFPRRENRRLRVECSAASADDRH